MERFKSFFLADSFLLRLAGILLSIFIFLFSIDLMGESFRHLGEGVIESILQAASNPLVGLFIGLLITAVIQSSSASTTLFVTAVATGSVNFTDAVPMIMGANIGTTITSTLVSLGFLGNREEFKRALSCAVVHDFFNILVVLILFPLEYKFGVLSSAAAHIASLTGISSVNYERLSYQNIDMAEITGFYTSILDNSLLNLFISFILLFASLKLLAYIISRLIIGPSKEKLNKYLFGNTLKSFFWGLLVTGGVQSSSITTSVVVPFVAKGKVSLRNVTPFILGSNIGTTITAFIAVVFESYEAVSIAIVHLVFNIAGVLMFLVFPAPRQLLMMLAESFGDLVSKYRYLIVIYLLLLFFIIPYLLIYIVSEVLN